MRGGRAALAVAVAAGLLCALAGPASLAAAPKKKRKPAPREQPVNFDKNLPVLGTKLAAFPPGPAKKLADDACLGCHSTDMVVQQHLTEKQWVAEVVKMSGWGAAVPEEKRNDLVAYFVQNFGPDNTNWKPVVARPVGR